MIRLGGMLKNWAFHLYFEIERGLFFYSPFLICFLSFLKLRASPLVGINMLFPNIAVAALTVFPIAASVHSQFPFHIIMLRTNHRPLRFLCNLYRCSRNRKYRHQVFRSHRTSDMERKRFYTIFFSVMT